MEDKGKQFVALVIVTTLLIISVVTGWLGNMVNSPNQSRFIVGETVISGGVFIALVFGLICLVVVFRWLVLLFSRD